MRKILRKFVREKIGVGIHSLRRVVKQMKKEFEVSIKRRILEIVHEKDITLTALCLDSNLTPSTVFDFMYGKSHCPKVSTIKKLCAGAGITLNEFFDREYFNETFDVYN